MKITDISIRNLPMPEKGQKIHYDDALGGFGVRCTPRTKSFILTYGIKRKRHTLGHYPKMSLAEARKRAREFLADTAVKPVFDSSIKYKDAVQEFLEFCKTKNRPDTVRQYNNYLTGCPFKRNVSDITRKDVLRHAAKYPEGGAGRRHLLASLRVFFRWCLRKDYIEKNPIEGEIILPAASRTRILTQNELKLIYHFEDKPFSDIVKLLILMGQRRTETTSIHSDWIDGDTIIFPREITKNKREHTIPFGNLTRPLLQGQGLLFENDVGTVFNGFGKVKKRLDAALQKANNDTPIPQWTLHDLRRTFASTHAMLGTPLHITELLLNHASGTISGVTAVYNRYQYLDEKREAVSQYETYLAEILDIFLI